MLVVIEGADKTGKSTLAHAIEKRFGYRYCHFGAPGPDPGREYAEFLLNLKEPTVCDRFYIGEQVYGPLLRNKTIITNLQRTVIERLCRLRGTVIIWACTPLAVTQERLAKSTNEAVTLEENEKAWKMFKRVIAQCKVYPLGAYDSSKPGALEKVLLELDPVLNTMRQMSGLAKYYCSGIGTITGHKMVVVGEAVNEKATWLGLPFDRGLSSEFLYSCMREAQVPEARVYTCNADKLTVEEAMFIKQGGDTEPWLALGDTAHKRLDYLGISHSFIPHPQYWRRFKSANRHEYVEMIKQWVYDYMVLQNKKRLEECSL